MYTYTITDSDEIWGNSNSCCTLAITNEARCQTRFAEDLTYLNEVIAQYERAFLFDNM